MWSMTIPIYAYPRAALNGQPTMAPAATPRTAKAILSMYHPVMAITVQYMQKLLGRKAEIKRSHGVRFCKQSGKAFTQIP